MKKNLHKKFNKKEKNNGREITYRLLILHKRRKLFYNKSLKSSID